MSRKQKKLQLDDAQHQLACKTEELLQLKSSYKKARRQLLLKQASNLARYDECMHEMFVQYFYTFIKSPARR